jgi:hypothetical protein
MGGPVGPRVVTRDVVTSILRSILVAYLDASRKMKMDPEITSFINHVVSFD